MYLYFVPIFFLICILYILTVVVLLDIIKLTNFSWKMIFLEHLKIIFFKNDNYIVSFVRIEIFLNHICKLS